MGENAGGTGASFNPRHADDCQKQRTLHPERPSRRGHRCGSQNRESSASQSPAQFLEPLTFQLLARLHKPATLCFRFNHGNSATRCFAFPGAQMESTRRPCSYSLPLIALWCIAFAASVQAQDSSSAKPVGSPANRPRIGLALSGGGALGLSEIGVIQWLEENHIPVDRIAGTSMGAIIGAMYATGMSPAEMKTFAEKINWDEALAPAPEYSQISYRRKEDRRDFLINAPLGLRHGLSGPNGYNPGQGVGLLLDRIAFPEAGVSSFDELPIPFRCVATDMQSGDRVILQDGSLAQAVRASMAIPGLFTPVQINGRMLADGGMVQNIPVETVRSMDADEVIAVELRLPPGDIKELNTLTGVLSRAIDVMIIQNEHRSLESANAKVSVDMSGYWVSDYSRVRELIELGYRSASIQSDQLLKYAIHDRIEWQKYLDDRNARKRRPIEEVHSIVVSGADRDADSRIRQRLGNNLDKPLNLPALEKQLNQIAGEGQFDHLGYEGFVQNGVPSLRIATHEKSYGPPFVDLAVNVEGSGVAAFDFSAGAR